MAAWEGVGCGRTQKQQLLEIALQQQQQQAGRLVEAKAAGCVLGPWRAC